MSRRLLPFLRKWGLLPWFCCFRRLPQCLWLRGYSQRRVTLWSSHIVEFCRFSSDRKGQTPLWTVPRRTRTPLRRVTRLSCVLIGQLILVFHWTLLESRASGCWGGTEAKALVCLQTSHTDKLSSPQSLYNNATTGKPVKSRIKMRLCTLLVCTHYFSSKNNEAFATNVLELPFSFKALSRNSSRWNRSVKLFQEAVWENIRYICRKRMVSVCIPCR